MVWLDPMGKLCVSVLCERSGSLRMGKTTLLTHIAARKLSIPPNIDVLYCEQGMLVFLLSPTAVLFSQRLKSVKYQP